MNRLLKWLRSLLKPDATRPQPRICSECNQHIKRNHKWFYFEQSQRHKDCSDPELTHVEQLEIPE